MARAFSALTKSSLMYRSSTSQAGPTNAPVRMEATRLSWRPADGADRNPPSPCRAPAAAAATAGFRAGDRASTSAPSENMLNTL